MTQYKLSVVTATYNAASVLPRLIESLMAQTDSDFEWVIADGQSNDETVEILEAARSNFKRMVLDSRPDFGIYDALNRGIQLSCGEYYLVLGADDELFPDAVANYKSAISKCHADFVTAKHQVNHSTIKAKINNREWLFGQYAHVYGHAVSLSIKKTLHQRIGWYSKKFPIAADQLFILKAIKTGATVSQESFVAGRFHLEGLSSTDTLGRFTESCRIQIMMGHNKGVQLILLMLKILKNFRKI